MATTYQGSCLCGSVRYQAVGPISNVVACHCNQCRKQSGHYFASTNVYDGRLSIEGAENLTWFQSSENAKRGFCRSCGSALFWKHNKDDFTAVLAGSIDGETGLATAKHIHCANKGDYYVIPDDAPQTP
jgi:hypothetical protein